MEVPLLLSALGTCWISMPQSPDLVNAHRATCLTLTSKSAYGAHTTRQITDHRQVVPRATPRYLQVDSDEPQRAQRFLKNLSQTTEN